VNVIVWSMLAQGAPVPVEAPGPLFCPFDKVTFLDQLTGLHEIWAVLILALGVVFLLNGWKLFKPITVLNAAALGAWGGFAVGGLIDGPNLQVLTTVAFGLLMGVLAWQLTNGAVSAMGAIAGAIAGYGLWSYVCDVAVQPALARHAWAGALLGMVSLGLLAFITARPVVMFFTAFQGAVMAVCGMMALALKPYGMPDRIRQPMMDNVHLLPLLIAAPTVLCFSLQLIAARKKGAGAKKK